MSMIATAITTGAAGFVQNVHMRVAKSDVDHRPTYLHWCRRGSGFVIAEAQVAVAVRAPCVERPPAVMTTAVG